MSTLRWQPKKPQYPPLNSPPPIFTPVIVNMLALAFFPFFHVFTTIFMIRFCFVTCNFRTFISLVIHFHSYLHEFIALFVDFRYCTFVWDLCGIHIFFVCFFFLGFIFFYFFVGESLYTFL